MMAACCNQGAQDATSTRILTLNAHRDGREDVVHIVAADEGGDDLEAAAARDAHNHLGGAGCGAALRWARGRGREHTSTRAWQRA